MLVDEFLKNKPEVLKKILSQLKRPLHDAAAVNATRNALFTKLLNTGLPVTVGTGGQTKWNRSKLNIPKTHALDAACVGDVSGINNWYRPHIEVKCTGRGRHKRTTLDKFGFPRAYLMKTKRVFGFASNDLVSAVVKVNTVLQNIIAKVIVKARGNFVLYINNLQYNAIHHKCKLLQRADGYNYGVRDYEFIYLQNKIISL